MFPHQNQFLVSINNFTDLTIRHNKTPSPLPCKVAEIQAATLAINIAHEEGFNGIKIYSDSNHLINGACDWMEKWKRNGWVTYCGSKVSNRKDWKALDDAIQKYGYAIEFVKVQAHSGNFGNEQADRFDN